MHFIGAFFLTFQSYDIFHHFSSVDRPLTEMDMQEIVTLDGFGVLDPGEHFVKNEILSKNQV